MAPAKWGGGAKIAPNTFKCRFAYYIRILYHRRLYSFSSSLDHSTIANTTTAHVFIIILWLTKLKDSSCI